MAGLNATDSLANVSTKNHMMNEKKEAKKISIPDNRYTY